MFVWFQGDKGKEDAKSNEAKPAAEPEPAKPEPAKPVERVEKDEEKKAETVQRIRREMPIGRAGGVYIPPHKLAEMNKAAASDKSSAEFQRMTWEALRKSINGLINKVNVANIKNIVPELLAENLIRGRGLFARSCMKAQMASPTFTHVYAALVGVINTKFPENGELIVKRLILLFRRAYKVL